MATYNEIASKADALMKAAHDTSLPVEMRTKAAETAKALGQKLDAGEYDDDTNAVASAIKGFGQGATFGFSDEIGAGIRAAFFDPLASSALGRWAFGGDVRAGGADGDYISGMGERYNRALEDYRGDLADARREDPFAVMGGELLGGLTQGGAGLARATAGKGILAAMGSGAKTGALYGGAAGYGYSEGDPLATGFQKGDALDPNVLNEGIQAVNDTVMGVGTGALLGGIVPAVGTGAKKFAQLFTKKMNMLDEGNRQLVMQAIQRDIDSGKTTWGQIEQKLKDNPRMILGDIGPNTQAMVDDVAQSATPAGTAMKDFLKQRNREQWDRMYPRAAEMLGGNRGPLHEVTAALEETARRQGDELYGVAYRQPAELTARMRNYMSGPSFKGIKKKAVDLMKDDMAAMGLSPDDVAKIDLDKDILSTKELDYMLRAMDAKVTKLFKKGDAAASTAKRMRNAFRDDLYAQNRYLRLARNNWSGNQSMLEAMERGRRIFKDDFEGIDDMMDDMLLGKKAFFRMGVAKEVIDQMARKTFDGDITKSIMNTPAKEMAIKAAFGNRKKFHEFLRYVESEKEMFQTFAGTAGSDTARRGRVDVLEQMFKLGGYFGGLSMGGFASPAMTGFLSGKTYGALRDKFSPSAGDLFASQAGVLMGNSLEGLTRPTLTRGLLSPGAPSASSRILGAPLTTGILNPNGPMYGDYGDR